MEKKIAYKLLDEISGKMKTFKTDEEMNAFIEAKNVECPVMLKLVQNDEIEYKIDASNTVYYFIKIEVFGKDKKSGEYEKMDVQFKIDFQTINQTELNIDVYSFSWSTNDDSGYCDFESINETIKHWFFGDEEEEYFDNYYYDSSSNCRCGGAGACIQCNPSMFI